MPSDDVIHAFNSMHPLISFFLFFSGYVAGHIRYKFTQRKRRREGDNNNNNNSDNDNDDNDDEDNENPNEPDSVWYDCLGTAEQGGIAISGAWTSSNIILEVEKEIKIAHTYQ